MTRAYILIGAALLPAALFARDINLDDIYLRKDSPTARRLPVQKLDAYQSVRAHLVDRGVIFAGWLVGPELFYIQEAPGLSTNIISTYNADKQRRTEITRIPGVITAVRPSSDGGFIAIKRLIQRDEIVPGGETVIYSFRTGKTLAFATPTGFLDFDIPEGPASIVYEASEGMVEYHPDTGRRRLVMEKRKYASYVVRGGATVALLSPGRGHTLLISGGGGNYSARIFGGPASFAVSGIGSAAETYWLDAHTLAFRGGAPGSYSVQLYDIRKRSSATLLPSSLNTAITYSRHSSTLSFLSDQLICLYDLHSARTLMTGLEGEEVSLSPNGGRFISILNGRLFIVNILGIGRNELLLRRSWSKILATYRELERERSHWENEYSLDYIRRKIRLYSSLIDG